jgi:hypothetical protein
MLVKRGSKDKKDLRYHMSRESSQYVPATLQGQGSVQDSVSYVDAVKAKAGKTRKSTAQGYDLLANASSFPKLSRKMSSEPSEDKQQEELGSSRQDVERDLNAPDPSRDEVFHRDARLIRAARPNPIKRPVQGGKVVKGHHHH